MLIGSPAGRLKATVGLISASSAAHSLDYGGGLGLRPNMGFPR
jgi:hypothetical protein